MLFFSIFFRPPHLSFPHNLVSFFSHKIQFVLVKYSCMCDLPLESSWLTKVYTFRENGPCSHQPTITNSSLGQSGNWCGAVLSMLWFGLLGLSWVLCMLSNLLLVCPASPLYPEDTVSLQSSSILNSYTFSISYYYAWSMSLCSRDFNINIWALLGTPFGIFLFSQSKLIVGLCSKHYWLQTSFSGSASSVGLMITQ